VSITIDHPTIPEAIRKLPRDARGYPIPFAQFRAPDGTPDFRVIDQQRVQRCIKDRLCGICGEVLNYWIVFIGGPACKASHLYADPPMHPGCAAFAAIACPFVAGTHTRYSSDRLPEIEGMAFKMDPTMVDAERRPAQMYLFTARRFERRVVGSEVYFYAKPFKIDEIPTIAERFAPQRCPVAADA
jgi:hypothetical protein